MRPWASGYYGQMSHGGRPVAIVSCSLYGLRWRSRRPLMTDKEWCLSVRLPEPMPGLERILSHIRYAEDLLGPTLVVIRAVETLRGRYFAARLDGLDDEQAAERAWVAWNGGGG